MVSQSITSILIFDVFLSPASAIYLFHHSILIQMCIEYWSVDCVFVSQERRCTTSYLIVSHSQSVLHTVMHIYKSNGMKRIKSLHFQFNRVVYFDAVTDCIKQKINTMFWFIIYFVLLLRCCCFFIRSIFFLLL